jgi:hypothetical protein
MICPKCYKEQSEGSTECDRCGIIFAKWDQPAQRPKSIKRPSVPEPTAPSAETVSATNIPDALVLILKLLFVAMVICGWYWFVFPVAGNPVPENAYKDGTNNFAIVIPEDWKWETTNKCGGQYNSCEVLLVYKDMGEQHVRPVVNIVVLDQKNIGSIFSNTTVSFTNKNKDEYAKDAVKGISTAFDSYQMEESAILDVDGIPSLAIDGYGTVAGYSLRGNFIMIPSSSHLFALSFAGPEFYQSVFRDMATSFRVTANRPSNFHFTGGLFGSLKGDLILGLLVGLTLAMIKFLMWSDPLKSD